MTVTEFIKRVESLFGPYPGDRALMLEEWKLALSNVDGNRLEMVWEKGRQDWKYRPKPVDVFTMLGGDDQKEEGGLKSGDLLDYAYSRQGRMVSEWHRLNPGHDPAVVNRDLRERALVLAQYEFHRKNFGWPAFNQWSKQAKTREGVHIEPQFWTDLAGRIGRREVVDSDTLQLWVPPREMEYYRCTPKKVGA